MLLQTKKMLRKKTIEFTVALIEALKEEFVAHLMLLPLKLITDSLKKLAGETDK